MRLFKLRKRVRSLESFVGASYDSEEQYHNEQDYGTMREIDLRLKKIEEAVFPKYKKRR
jgi:hypothetical protein